MTQACKKRHLRAPGVQEESQRPGAGVYVCEYRAMCKKKARIGAQPLAGSGMIMGAYIYGCHNSPGATVKQVVKEHCLLSRDKSGRAKT